MLDRITHLITIQEDLYSYQQFGTIVRIDSLMKVNLIMANNKMFEHPGIVETIEADFNNETGNIAFRATFLILAAC